MSVVTEYNSCVALTKPHGWNIVIDEERNLRDLWPCGNATTSTVRCHYRRCDIGRKVVSLLHEIGTNTRLVLRIPTVGSEFRVTWWLFA